MVPVPSNGVGDVPFAIVPIAGKGFGCVALRDIDAGERLYAEEALVVTGVGEPALEESVARLAPKDRERFFALAQNAERFGERKTAEGIVATNAIPFRAGSRRLGGLFATLSRLNHSCESNCVYKYNSNLGMLTCHASRPIRAHTEITFNYGFEGENGASIYMGREGRRLRLRDAFGFDCTCEKCGLTGEGLRRSEANIAAIGDDRTLLAELHRVCEKPGYPTRLVAILASRRQLATLLPTRVQVDIP